MLYKQNTLSFKNLNLHVFFSKNIPATVDGMLGGFAHVSSPDIKESKNFLEEFLEVLFLCRITYYL